MHQSQVKMCFLRGPLRLLTEQENPKFLWSLENTQRDTTNLVISRDFFGYSKLMFLFFVFYHLCFLEIFIMAWKFGMGFFGGQILVQRFFGVLFEAQGIFLSFDFCPHLIIPVTWNPEYSLWPWVKLKRTLNFSHFPSRVNLYSLIGNCVGESNEKTKPSQSRKMHLKLKIPGNFCGFYWLRPWSPLSMGFWILQILASSILCKSPDYFIKISFHIVVDMNEARRVQHFPDFNLESIFITKNIFIMKNPTDLGKTVETSVDPCLPNSRAQLSSWWIFNN